MPGVHFPPSPDSSRLPFMDALRALASLAILWHHFAIYPPFCEQIRPLAGAAVDWMHDHARVAQVFFVVGGYVMARGMTDKSWDIRAFGVFFMRRSLRLGIPYLAAIVFALVACAFGRGVLPESVTGAAPGAFQLLAHLFFLQDLLGFESLSAGLWFVCINIQLGLVYSAMLVLRDTLAPRLPGTGGLGADMIAGWSLAAASLFVFNGHEEWDSTALYFFPHFFTGVLAQRCTRSARDRGLFLLYLILSGAALAHDWRVRLLVAIAVGCLVVAADRCGWSARWPKSRVIAGLARISYSLFLIHFPVLVVVSTVWAKMGWNSQWQALCGLFAAFFASLGAAMLSHRFVEEPAGALARRWVVPGRKSRAEYPAAPLLSPERPLTK